jgi:bifunctional NMN adenylyltransferase/nudix hydrolase
VTPVNAPLAVVIGCFPLYHRGHHALVTAALAHAEEVVVVIGSAFHARTPRDPFTVEEREAMIRLCLDGADRERLRAVPVRDYYDDERWAAAVRAAVEGSSARRPVSLSLDARANAQRYREWFPQWPQHVVPDLVEVDARRLRCILLEKPLEEALAAIEPWVPGPVAEYLRAWTRLPHYAELAADQKAIRDMLDQWRGAPYPPIFTTVDAVVVDAGHVLLVKRKGRPGPGLWALPGGFLDAGERLFDGALRELHEETGLAMPPALMRRRLRRVAVFDHPARSQRGRTITHAHFFQLDHDELPEVKGGDDAAAAEWVPLERLPAMEAQFFEDHFHILDEFLRLTP